MDHITIESFEKNLNFFHKMYDIVRLVDPVGKTVLESRASGREATDEICYDYWSNNKICDNCISVRAHLHNKCYLKLEQSANAIMMVTALPVENAGRPTVLELLKNATETMMIGNGQYAEGRLMSGIVSEINDLVIRDELTGQYNRRYVNERLPADIVRATLERTPLSVIFIDIDNLKKINDTYGHSCGDKAIAAVMDTLLRCIRADTDWAARYGGDEFFICLNRTGEKEAGLIAERIRSKVGETAICEEDGPIRTAVSLGVYTMDGELTADELIALADRRMYEDKKRSRESSGQ